MSSFTVKALQLFQNKSLDLLAEVGEGLDDFGDEG